MIDSESPEKLKAAMDAFLAAKPRQFDFSIKAAEFSFTSRMRSSGDGNSTSESARPTGQVVLKACDNDGNEVYYNFPVF